MGNCCVTAEDKNKIIQVPEPFYYNTNNNVKSGPNDNSVLVSSQNTGELNYSIKYKGSKKNEK